MPLARMSLSPLFRAHGVHHGDTHTHTRALELLNRHATLYADTEFRHFLSLERKRTERTGRPLLLVVINIGRFLVHAADDHEALHQLALVLQESSRETDVKGWYVPRCAIGMIYTEIGDATERTLLLKLEQNIKRSVGGENASLIELWSARFPLPGNG